MTAVSAAPILENGHARGVLVVDRQERDPFTSVEEELLTAATHFALRAAELERLFAIMIERARASGRR